MKFEQQKAQILELKQELLGFEQLKNQILEPWWKLSKLEQVKAQILEELGQGLSGFEQVRNQILEPWQKLSKFEQAKKQILKLRQKLLKWNYQYYTLDKPLVSDSQYDAHLEKLKRLEQKYPHLITIDSPTQKVGGEVIAKFIKIKHSQKMLSLLNAFRNEDLINFERQIQRILHTKKDVECVSELKIDGLSFALIYQKGLLTKALTRGDGIFGEDITHNVKTIKSIPHTIPYKQKIEFRGEIFMSKTIFKQLSKTGVNFVNPRNAAAGTMRQLDSKIAFQRKLDAFLYSIVNPLNHNLMTQQDVIKFIAKQNLKINPESQLTKNIQNVIDYIKQYSTKYQNFDYGVDGIVIKVNDNKLHEEIGYTSKAPKYMIAYKFPEKVVTTKLLDIYPTIGRTGRVTYNAKLEPVMLSGTIVSNATLHNANYVKKILLDIGDIVKIKKAGEIIPKVIANKFAKTIQKWSESKICPRCQSKLIRFESEIDQYCINITCPAILLAMIQHFASRKAMDIQGLGKKIISTLIKEKLLISLLDIYKLENQKSKLLSLDNFQQKSVQNLIDAINVSKNCNLNQFIYALGIRYVGLKNATILAQHFGSLQNIFMANKDQLLKIREIGPKAQKSIINYFKINQKLVDNFLNLGIKFNLEQEMHTKLLLNKTFVITGVLSKVRSFFKKIIETNGGNVTSLISSKTNYLLVGKEPGSKLIRGKELKIDTINEVSFGKLINNKI